MNETLTIMYKTTTKTEIAIIKGNLKVLAASVEASLSNGVLHLTELGATGAEIQLYIWTQHLESIRVMP